MKKILFVLFSVVSSLSLVSCLGDSDGVRTGQIAAYFNISGVAPNYVFTTDDDMCTVKLNPSSSFPEKIADYKRAYLVVQYTDDNYVYAKDGSATITNGEILSGRFVPIKDVITPEKAEADKISVADSIYEMSSATIWYAKGYLNTYINALYCLSDAGQSIYPAFTAVVGDEDITTNAVKVNILCNRHPQKSVLPYGPYGFDTSFDILSTLSRVPGNDSITITVTGKGLDDKQIRVARGK